MRTTLHSAFDWILYSGIFPFIMTPPPSLADLTFFFLFFPLPRSPGQLLLPLPLVLFKFGVPENIRNAIHQWRVDFIKIVGT